MGRYRKVDTRMWGDAKFRNLSAPEPSGQHLWFFLLTGPHTTNLPGLFRAGAMGLAESLGWPIEGFRKAFAELFQQGLAQADWNARVVWIPNAIRYNPPENPNVVKSWRDSWDEVPECQLKDEAYERLKVFTEGLGEGFAKAFVKCCAKSLANQEQEQEQEQHTYTQQPSPKTSRAKKKSTLTHLPQAFTISEEVRKWADKNGHDRLDERLDHFRNQALAQNYRYADWDAAFKNAIRGDWAKLNPPAQSKNGKASPKSVALVVDATPVPANPRMQDVMKMWHRDPAQAAGGDHHGD